MNWACGCVFEGPADREYYAKAYICPVCRTKEIETNTEHPVRYGYPSSHPWIPKQVAL